MMYIIISYFFKYIYIYKYKFIYLAMSVFRYSTQAFYLC